MLFKWITHEFCSSRLESRSRAVRSGIMDLEVERKEVDKRIRQEGKQLQHNLEDLVAQRQAEIRETVAFLNRHLISCQDMVQALQKYTEQAYATVEIWLQNQVQWGAYNSAKQRIKLLKEQRDFLQEADKAYRVLRDTPKRQEWRTIQPESAFAANSHVQTCVDALKRRRDAIAKRSRTIDAALERIGSQLRWTLTELQKARYDKENIRVEAETCRSKHKKQRDLMKEAFLHAIELHKKLENQSIGSLKEQREQLSVELKEARKKQAFAKEVVNRAYEERNFVYLERKKSARDLARQRGDIAFDKLTVCREKIKEIKSQLQPHWDKLNPDEHRQNIEIHLDGFLKDPKRRIQAMGSRAHRPSNSHRNYLHLPVA